MHAHIHTHTPFLSNTCSHTTETQFNLLNLTKWFQVLFSTQFSQQTFNFPLCFLFATITSGHSNQIQSASQKLETISYRILSLLFFLKLIPDQALIRAYMQTQQKKRKEEQPSSPLHTGMFSDLVAHAELLTNMLSLCHSSLWLTLSACTKQRVPNALMHAPATCTSSSSSL